MKKLKAIFLDRDGVLNKVILKKGKPHPPASIEELSVPEDVLPALKALKKAGFLLICVTNQPDVRRGVSTYEKVEAINQALNSILPLDDVRTCYHDDSDQCHCRKPKPGLLLQAAEDYSIELQGSFMIGDRWKDIDAGQKAGCKTIWINQHYEESSPHSPDCIVSSMKEASDWILKNI
jgi:D-glycero-D-manno-heptose 1,7-bisphosphate phosphatase